MRALILLATILLCCQASFAVAPLATLPKFDRNPTLRNTDGVAVSTVDNPPKKKVFYQKGKGTMGLVAGITLGPVGFLSVHLFSHNLTMRKKAKQGLKIWAGVVILAGLICLVVISSKGKGGGSSSRNDFQFINFGGTSTGAPNRKKRVPSPSYIPPSQPIPVTSTSPAQVYAPLSINPHIAPVHQ